MWCDCNLKVEVSAAHSNSGPPFTFAFPRGGVACVCAPVHVCARTYRLSKCSSSLFQIWNLWDPSTSHTSDFKSKLLPSHFYRPSFAVRLLVLEEALSVAPEFRVCTFLSLSSFPYQDIGNSSILTKRGVLSPLFPAVSSQSPKASLLHGLWRARSVQEKSTEENEDAFARGSFSILSEFSRSGGPRDGWSGAGGDGAKGARPWEVQNCSPELLPLATWRGR